ERGAEIAHAKPKPPRAPGLLAKGVSKPITSAALHENHTTAVRQSAGSLKAIVEQRSDWFRIAPASLHSVGMIARRQVDAAADRTLPLSRPHRAALRRIPE